MDRRQMLTTTATIAAAAALDPALAAATASTAKPLKPPANGKIPVAVLLSEHAQVIDFAGPWEVFQGAHVLPTSGAGESMPFELFTVAPSKEAIRATGGMRILPDYTFDDAPPAKVIVVPAQGGLREKAGEAKQWLVDAASKADVTMSVCTGAFVLGYAGLLDGLSATTYHRRLDQFQQTFPKVNLIRGVRFVENEKISTSAGLSAGIDLALRVVERYFGRDAARATATNLEYEGKGWVV